MKILGFILFVTFSWPLFAAYRDPFRPSLPDKVALPVAVKPLVVEEKVLPDSIRVEGVLWGSENPQAIINGRVYFVGDQIEATGATISQIEGNIVFISYMGKIFTRTVQSREAR